jgi:alkylation response protein AidB-like acyl-CoA dehydrogenase
MLVLNEERRLLRDAAKSAIVANAPLSLMRQLRANGDEAGYSVDFWRECATVGWTGILIPEAYGGLDFGLVGAGLIAREMGRTLAASPFLSTAVIAASLLNGGGSEALKSRWLPEIVAGQAVLSLAIDEAARHDPSRIATTAARTAHGWRIDGAKICVLEGHVADAILVVARADSRNALFLVEKNAPGLTRGSRALVDSRRVGALHFEAVEIAAEAELGGGQALIDRGLDIGRAVLSATLSGVVEEAFERTLAYLKQRRQFDRAIGSFQALQHRVATLHVAIENAWSASFKALQALEEGAADAPLWVGVAKSKASETARRATAECLQLHGGIGMTDEFDIGLFLKKAQVDSELLGDAGFHADRVATLLGY